MSMSTVTIQQVVNYALQHVDMIPLTGVGGVANEPALSIANDTLNMLCSENFPWKCNRAELPPLVTAPNKQDYKFAGSSAFTLTGGGVGIDLKTNNAITQAGSTVTVNLLESCLGIFNVGDTVYLSNVTQAAIAAVYTLGQGNNGTSSGWSNGFAIATIATNGLSFTFTYAPAISTDGAPGITNLSWLEGGTQTQTANTSVVPYIWYLEAVRTIQPAGRVSISDKVSIKADLGTGVIIVRFMYLPGSQPFTVNLVYQQKPPLVTNLSQTWAPFPDNYIHAIRQMFVAMAYRYAQGRQEQEEFQKAMALSASLSGADDREDSQEYMAPEQGLMQGFGWGGWEW